MPNVPEGYELVQDSPIVVIRQIQNGKYYVLKGDKSEGPFDSAQAANDSVK